MLDECVKDTPAMLTESTTNEEFTALRLIVLSVESTLNLTMMFAL
jgi:hypothetical protein